MKTKLLIAIALADLIVFGAWIGREVHARNVGAEVHLPVEGYDPRDLLSGHYIRFRLVADREADALATGPHSYCLEMRDTTHHVSTVRESRDDCSLFITRTDDSFGVDRFYIDERHADELARLNSGEDTYLVARVTTDGRIHPQHLIVQGALVK